MKIQRFEDLECWQEARTLLKMIYDAINSNERFQRDFRLSNQMTGAGISVVNNVPEFWDGETARRVVKSIKIIFEQSQNSYT